MSVNFCAQVVLGPFEQRTTCTYHDHTDPENANFRGQIRVGFDEGPTGPGYLQPW